MTHTSPTLTITSLGGMGDGIANHAGQTIFVPLTCPGDVVEADIQPSGKGHIRATVTQIVTPSSDRQTPPCQHFGCCGGCSLQHIRPEIYNQYKQGILADCLKNIGADIAVMLPMIEVGHHSRRRAEFKIAVFKGQVQIGFFAARSHDIIELEECPVSDSRLTALLPALKTCLQGLKKPSLLKAISLTVLEGGLDAILIARSPLSAADRAKLVAFAELEKILRLAEHIETAESAHVNPANDTSHVLYDSGKAIIRLGQVDVSLPVGAFLQATAAGQRAITDIVMEHLGGCASVVDLYSGCGTYSFPLAAQARVSAYEGSSEMVMAMHNAALRHGLEARVRATTRDIFAKPLSVEELNRFDGVVINPPRNGALPQIRNIGKSEVGKVVMVSCNPATFERDAKSLIDSGYRLTLAVPIDQFHWSGHLELVAVFER